MTKKKLFRLLLNISITFIVFLDSSCSGNDKYIAIRGYAQGGTYTVKLNMTGKDGRIKIKPESIKEKIDSILNEIDTTLSGYDKGSMLSRFNEGKKIRPNDIFKDIYTVSFGYFRETGGAFDVAAAPLFDLWGFGFTTDSMPTDSAVKKILGSTGMGRLKSSMSDAIKSDGTLEAEDMLSAEKTGNYDTGRTPELNYNAIAQGYTCDLIAKYLYGLGIKDMLIDIGEIYCDGVNPEGKPWTVGIDRPFDGNETPGQDLDGIWQSSGTACGIVTSGNYRKFYIKNGKKYAHTIDPRSGYPVAHSLLSATIVAKSATIADAYATYCMVIGLEQSEKFIESKSGEVQGYLIYSEDGTMKEWTSDGFNLIGK
ncbi:MAG: FAD:protein FMN transferase [Bacteroidales bacterium]|jgi:thiamine biosynthesis lipoprotein|nr:FAD:protein FMN transferase [Bacteroidales bacterium]